MFTGGSESVGRDNDSVCRGGKAGELADAQNFPAPDFSDVRDPNIEVRFGRDGRHAAEFRLLAVVQVAPLRAVEELPGGVDQPETDLVMANWQKQICNGKIGNW